MDAEHVVDGVDRPRIGGRFTEDQVEVDGGSGQRVVDLDEAGCSRAWDMVWLL
ncbi:hypothetical protein [Streptomyces sp. HC307]|uniref:hypothetical protein n=1 Tax=Streptomyces flavusporus TaxID=3385496 RepID=UPI003916E265